MNDSTTIKFGWQSFMWHACKRLKEHGEIYFSNHTVASYFKVDQIYPEYQEMDTKDWVKLFELMYNQLKTYKSIPIVEMVSEVEIRVAL